MASWFWCSRGVFYGLFCVSVCVTFYAAHTDSLLASSLYSMDKPFADVLYTFLTMMSLPVSVLQLLPNVLTGLCTIPVQISSISLIFSEHGCCVVTFWSSSWLDTVFHTVCSACWCVMRLFFSVFRCSSRNSLKWDNETPTWRHSLPLALGKNAKWTRQEQRRQALRYEPLHWTICTFHLVINSLLSSSILSCDLWEVWFIWANQFKRSRFKTHLIQFSWTMLKHALISILTLTLIIRNLLDWN